MYYLLTKLSEVITDKHSHLTTKFEDTLNNHLINNDIENTVIFLNKWSALEWIYSPSKFVVIPNKREN